MTSRGPLHNWLNRNVVGIGLADLAADSNYEMILAVLPLFITAGLGAPVVVSMEQSLSGSLVEDPKLGTAYGVLNGINGVGDLGSSIIAGVLYSVNPAAAMAFGAAFAVVASAILWSWRGQLSPSLEDRTSASRPSSTA